MQTILCRDTCTCKQSLAGAHGGQIIVIEGKFSKYDSHGLEKPAFLLEIS